MGKEGDISDHLKMLSLVIRESKVEIKSPSKWENPQILPLRKRVSLKTY